MQIEIGAQPNCSELVVRLGNAERKAIEETLSEIGVEEYVIRSDVKKKSDWDDDNNIAKRIKMSELGKKIRKAWDDLDDWEDQDNVDKARALLKANGIDPYDCHISLCENGVESELTLRNDPYDDGYAIWLGSSYESSQFPLVKKIADHFGVEPEGHDGGSSSSYEDWLSGEDVEDE